MEPTVKDPDRPGVQASVSCDALRLLYDIQSLLTDSASPLDRMLTAFAERLVPEFADTCVIDLRSEDHLTSRVAFETDSVALKQHAPEFKAEYPLYRSSPSLTAGDALRRGQGRIYERNIADLAVFLGAATEEHRQWLSPLQHNCALAIPIMFEDKPTGVVTCIGHEGREFDAECTKAVEVAVSLLSGAISRVRLNQRLKIEAGKALSATMYKEALLSTLSHELRTPLQVMLGWTHMLRVTRLSRQALGKVLDSIERSIKSQGYIVNELLELSRISSGRLEMTVKPCELRPIVNSVLKMVEISVRAKQIELVFKDLAGTPVWVVADVNWLQRAIRNVLSNAVKFTPDHGKITVELAADAVSTTITITDNGRGIAPEFLPHVFDRFSQAETGTTRSFGGLGIGLAIVHNIVESHGGSIEAISEGVNKGARFILSLPRCAAPEQTSETPAPVQPEQGLPLSLADVRVLLIEDQADTRELLRFVLEQVGAIVTEAPTAKMGLQLLQNGSFNVLVCDIGLPEEDGYWLIRKIRELGPDAGGNIPAMALTAYARAEDRVQILRAGFQLHVLKPVEPNELILSVSNLLKPTHSAN